MLPPHSSSSSITNYRIVGRYGRIFHTIQTGLPGVIRRFDTAEEAIAIFEVLPPKLVMNCMLFLMRSGIVPMWEDAQNRNGGCFSYKVANKEVNSAWKQLSYVTVGETISTNMNVVPIVNGITISPKKNFCIIKIWMANCNFQNAGVIRELEGITAHGCLFKKHTPEY
jgi:hypothetical protein